MLFPSRSLISHFPGVESRPARGLGRQAGFAGKLILIYYLCVNWRGEYHPKHYTDRIMSIGFWRKISIPGLTLILGFCGRWVVSSAAPLAAPTPGSYTITNLGTLGGGDSIPQGIDNLGEVVGYSTIDANGNFHAFVYRGGKMTDLQAVWESQVVTLLLPALTQRLGAPVRNLSSYAYAINDSGQLVGAFQLVNGPTRAFLESGNVKIQELGTLGGSDSVANSINNAAQVVGYSLTASGAQHAFLYTGGQRQDLGTLGGSDSVANSVNIAAQVVGYSLTASGAQHAFLYTGGQLQDLGTLGGSKSVATCIRNIGQIVGYSAISTDPESPVHAFLYSDGTMQDLGTLGGPSSYARAITCSGQIVGESLTAPGDVHAFLYMGGKMYDLNLLVSPNSGWTLVQATGINDAGQICATGTLDNVSQRAVLLTPTAGNNAR